MIAEQIKIYAHGKQVHYRPATITLKSTATVEGSIQFPWAVTGIETELAACTGPFTGINRHNAMYEISGADYATGLQSDDIFYRVAMQSVTGISHGQTYGYKVKARSSQGQKGQADLIINVDNEIG